MKISTRCVPTNSQPAPLSIDPQPPPPPPTSTYSKNPSTTRSWPVINRTYHQYDYEALYQLNTNNNHPYHNLHHLHNSNNNSSGSEYNSAYDKDSSDQNLYVSSGRTMQPQTQTTVTTTSCATAPPVIFLFVTLLVTTGATAMLCGAIMSDHWEHVDWDKNVVDRMTRNTTTTTVQWHLNGKVAGINVKRTATIAERPLKYPAKVFVCVYR